MATLLTGYTASVKNLVARPGTFSQQFPETNDSDIAAILADAFAECQLDEVLLSYSLSSGAISPDPSAGEMALVVLTAGIRFITSELFNRRTTRKYSAGPASFEETLATNIMRDIMRALQEKRTGVIDKIARGEASGGFVMADQYLAAAFHAGYPYDCSPAW